MTPLLAASIVLGVLFLACTGFSLLTPTKISHLVVVALLGTGCLGCLIAQAVIIAQRSEVFDVTCRASGGVPVAGTCLKKSSVLEPAK